MNIVKFVINKKIKYMKNILTLIAMVFCVGYLSAQTAAPASNTTPAKTGGPHLQWEATVIDYGEIKKGSDPLRKALFTNTGTEPLIIKIARGSCGCTVPTWPKDPIAPGGTGEIMVEFSSKGKLGPQSKTVTLTANTNPAQTFLTIKGEVAPAK